MQSIVRKAVRPFMVVLKGIILVLIICATGGAWAATDKTNPVTGATESYVNKFTGGTGSSWNEAGNWDKGSIPYVSGGGYTSALVDGGGTETVVTGTSIDGWTMKLGVYGGAKVTISGLLKWTGGNGTDYATVDATSKLTITSMSGNNWNHVVNYYVASPGGITYKCAFAPANDSATIQYNFAGNGSVVYESTVNKAGHHIKMADVTLTGTSQISSKTLVSFTSTTKTFTADAVIKVYDTDGTTLKKLVGVTAVRQSVATIASTASELTTADAVGTCEIVQCTDGIVLYYVDGAPSAVYTPSININFCFGNAPLTTTADVGHADYAVPGTSWNNMTSTSPASGNGTFTTPLSYVYAVKTDGTKSLVSGASVALSGTPGSYKCSSLAAATDLRHGYIDENANNKAPTVTVSGIPYDKYKVVVYTSTDTADKEFGYVSVNGTDYTYVNNELANSTTAWGASGASNSAKAIAEGVNMLVTPAISGSTATIVGHKGDSARGCIAAVQIVAEIGENDLLIELDGDETHTFNEAKTYDTVYVTGSGTLTFAGTASTAKKLYISGSAAVNMNGSSLTPSAVTGTGTAIYTGVLPAEGLGWTASAWTGTVWIKDFGSLSDGRAGESLTADMPNWGNSKSKVKFTNVKAYAHSQNLTCAYTLVLEDGTGSEEYAWCCDNGYQNNTLTVARLSGSGTFYDHSGPAATFTFNSFDGFTGKFDITSSGHQIKVPAGATLTVAQNSSIKFTSQGMLGTLNIAQGKTFTAASSDAVSYDTGSSTVNVYGTLDFDTFRWTVGPNTTINLDEGAIVCGTGDSSNSNAALDFNVAGGSTIHAIGNATVSCKIRNNKANGTANINVEEGKTLTFSGNHVGSYGLKKQGDGILKLTGSIEKLPTIEAGTVLLGGNKEWNLGTLRDLSGYTLEAGSSIVITQTNAEYGSGSTTVTGVDSSIASITVNKADGTTATLTRTDSTSTLVESVVVSGAACWYDFTFTNTLATAVGSVSTLTLTDDHTSNSTSEYGDLEDARSNTYRGVKSYRRPYGNINLGSKSQFTVATYATMPSSANTVLMAFGGTYDNNTALILASGADGDKAVLYYYVKSSNTLTELKTMPAIGSRTVPHLYVFQKVSDHQINIYLDGKLSLAYLNNDITFSVSSGFQMAAVYGGTPNGVSRLENSSDASAIAMTRIYDRILSAKEIEALKEAWPYYSPNGNSERELATDETAPDWNEDGKWDVDGASANAAKAKSVVVIENGAGASAAVAVNLDANTAYESLTVSGEDAVSFALKGGYTGKIVPAAASIETDTTLAVNAVDLAQGPVEVAAGKTLTFDVSSLVDANWANVASIASIQLTGVATLGTESSIAVTPTTSGYWNLAAEADAGGNYYLTFTPNRETGSIYWQSGTYWNSTYKSGDSPAVFTTDAEGQNATKYFAGDTVIIPTTTKRYFGPISDGAIIQFDCSGTIDISKTDSLGYALKNANVTVASGTTLNFVNSWNGMSPEVYGGTISGAGKVKVESGKKLTLSNGATLASETALTGAGEVVLASVPTAQMTFDDNWTGTVKLPQFAAAGAKLTFAGNSNSTVALAGITSGWLGETSTKRSDVAPALRLDGDVTISAMSTSWQYSFAKISGTGNLSFTSANAPSSLAITEIADYSGTLNNSTTTTLTVGRISLASAPAADTLLLATNGTGTVTVNAVYVNGSDSGMQVVYKEGGVYSPDVTYVAQYGETKYETIQDAIDAAEQAGQTYTAVTILDPNATCPDGYYVDTEDNNVLKKYAAAAVTVVGVTATTNGFTTFQAAINAAIADNLATYAVAYADGSATVAGISTFMLKPGAFNVTVTSSIAGYGDYAQVSEIQGYAGVYQYSTSPAAATFTWTGAAGDNLWATAKNWSSEDGTVNAGPANSLYTVELNTAATIALSGKVNIGTVNVGAAVTLNHVYGEDAMLNASSIVLTAAGASLAKYDDKNSMTLSSTPTTNVSHSRVKTVTVGGTTTYSVELIPGTIFSVY